MHTRINRVPTAKMAEIIKLASGKKMSSVAAKAPPVLNEGVLAVVNSLAEFDDRTVKLVKGLMLTTLEDASELWAKSTNTHPRLFPADECWNKTPPSSTDMILSTLNLIESTKSNPDLSCRVYCRGEVSATVDPRIAIAQLYEPKLTNPICLVGFKLPIIADSLLTTPLALSEFVESFDEADQQIILTPKFCLTDLHLDSADGISVTMGKCEKVWLCFPPTTRNLQLMRKAEGQKSKLMRIGKDLEGGMIFRTDSSQAIYLPVGTLHAVFTLVGGFLIAIDFTTPNSAKTYAALLRAELDGSGTFQEAIFGRFLSSVSLGLDNHKVIESVSAWVISFDRAKRRAADEKEWAATAQGMWDEFLGNWKGKKITCPCGKMGRQTFVEHFYTSHALKILKEKAVRSKRKRDNDSGPLGPLAKRGGKRKLRLI